MQMVKDFSLFKHSPRNYVFERLQAARLQVSLATMVDAELARVKSAAFNYLNTYLKNEGK
ncbi:hypothetical protein PC2016_2357 [Pseudoalteromonas carrageenovora]|nr:hypothetical protein PC2016_2357 [Pseudoalteromonas carrageenovora]